MTVLTRLRGVAVATAALALLLPATQATASPVAAAARPATAPVASPAAVASTPATDAEPLPGAHAHNDYLHAHPLQDALDHGFTSVEADVWLEDGRLCLGHAIPHCDRTLEAMYLAPLEERVRTRGGSAYAGWHGTMQLLVELKTDAATTWPAVEKALAAHPTLITHWEHGVRVSEPVEVVITGKRSLAQIAAADERWSAYDGDLDDLDRGISPELMPMVSADWWSTFTWRGGYPIPDDQALRLRRYADLAKIGGYTLRFYATPDLTDPVSQIRRRKVWDAERAAGVTWLNSDDLDGLEAYLRG